MTRGCLGIVLLAWWVVFLGGNAALASERERVAQAVTAYAHAQDLSDRQARLAGFQRAERLFQGLLEAVPETADLHANLGTAALQAEHLGSAVLAFRRALRLDPDHARALQNLRHARTLLPPWVPRPRQAGVFDDFFFWHQAFSLSERRSAAAISFLLAALGIAATIRWRSALARNVTVLPLLVWVGMVVSLWIQGESSMDRQGVIIARETIARASDSHNAPTRFAQPLPGGAEVEILERRHPWTKIGLANGRNAWIRDSALGLVGS